MLFGQRRVHQPPRVLAQRLQLARQALALRLVLDEEPAIAGRPAVVGEAEKGEGLRMTLAALSSSQGWQAAEPDLDLAVHGGNRDAVSEVCIDMSPGFIKGTADSLPKAAVTLRLPLGANRLSRRPRGVSTVGGCVPANTTNR